MSISSYSRPIIRFLACAWAARATAIGCCFALLALCFGATWLFVDGVGEVAGGTFALLVRLLPRSMRFDAITFGHIVLGRNHAVLQTPRLHEHTHVRQYERWGILFFLLYMGSSLLQWFRGEDPHYQNHFEREAYLRAASSIVTP